MTDQPMKTFSVHVGYFDRWTHGVVAIHAPDAATACREALDRAETDSEFFERVTRTDVVEGMPVFVDGVEECADPSDPFRVLLPTDGEPDDTGQNAIMARYYAGEIIEERDRLAAALAEIRAKGPDYEPDPDDYDDTESAFHRGIDVGRWEAAEIAARALDGIAPPAPWAERDRFRAALEAIHARARCEWDNPHLVATGPLVADTRDDMLRIADDALAEKSPAPDLAALLREAIPFLGYLAAEAPNPEPAGNLVRRIEAALSERGA